jgi:pyruvate-formate lyase
LSHEEAGELIDAFWVKLNGIKRGFQHVVLGGCDRDGNYAANDLTYLCLRATRKLKMDQPLISVRWRPEIPMALWDEILDLIQAGMGFPALFNDAVAIAAKQRLGVCGTDALVAIKRLVFQARKTSLTSLAEALRMNFARAMPLRKALLICPKYGNDMPDPDELMRDLVEFVCCKLEQYRNPRGGRFQAGMYTVETHAFMGKLTGALPDGRLRGLALANGHSPAQGADLSGPTAVVKSATQYDHRLLGNGMVLDLKFHPMFFSDPDALRALRHLVETYFRLGGMEIQFNVVSRETLVAAKKAPWDYRDLLVRVSGFSAYFVDLDGVTQDELIARVEHSTMSPSTVEAA